MRSLGTNFRISRPAGDCRKIQKGKDDTSKRSQIRRTRYKFEESELPLSEELMRTPDGLYICPEPACSIMFKEKSCFRWAERVVNPKHSADLLRKHLKQLYKVVKCPVRQCGHRSGGQTEMHRHVSVHHAQWASTYLGLVRNHKCPICSCEFTRRDNLVRHMKRGICLDKSWATLLIYMFSGVKDIRGLESSVSIPFLFLIHSRMYLGIRFWLNLKWFAVCAVGNIMTLQKILRIIT